MKQWVVFSLPRPYRFILNFSILRHLVEINCGTPSYAPLVVRQCSGFLFSTFLPDKILNRLFGIQYLTFAQTMLYNPSSSIPLKLMYRFGLEAASAYAGLSPSTYQSGQLQNCYAHMEKRGSRYLRYALFNAAKYVCLWCPTFSAYLEKKRSEGKHYNVAISHAAKKLVRLIFAMQRSGKAFLADY